MDGKNDLIVEYDVSLNPCDQHQLGKMVKKVKRRLKIKRFTVVADKGYYNGEDLLRVKRYKVKAIVSKQKPSDPKDQPERFHTDKFTYDPAADTYTCPMGKILHPHNKKTAKRRNFSTKPLAPHALTGANVHPESAPTVPFHVANTARFMRKRTNGRRRIWHFTNVASKL